MIGLESLMSNIVFGSLFILFVMMVFMVCAIIIGGRILGALAGGLGRMLGLVPSRPPMRMQPQMHTAMPPRMHFATAPQPQPAQWPQGYAQCQIPGCRHMNPGGARFCRHCGHAFPVSGQPKFIS